VPDGCADILCCNDGEPFLVGPDTQTRWLGFPDGLVITALRFRPGALRAVAGCDATEVLNASVALADLGGARGLAGDLHAAESAHLRIALLEAWVRARVSVSRRDLAVSAACRALARRPDVAIGGLAAQLGWSVRMLHREFTATCGYGPKHMQRILRVQRTLQLAGALREPMRLDALAASAGFADQAHMSRDFRAITGFSPGSYLALADPGLGRWIAEDW
jgi:AraC-like DNA-binding protein